ncbi:MAG: polysaccharide lyase family 7 protein [Polyangiaceae bacterium]
MTRSFRSVLCTIATAGLSACSGAHAQAGGGAAGQGGSPPAIDYSIWMLQLPIGTGSSPTTVPSTQLLAGFTNDYFYPAADGGQIFMDPETGSTTPGSQHCRSEMREATTGGGQAAWASSGSHSLTVTGKVLQVGGGSNGSVSVGQLFNGSDSIPLMELEYSTSKGGFQLLYEEAKGTGSLVDLETPVALNARYTFSLSLIDGVASVSIDGKNVYTKAPSAAVLSKSFYFKFGAYDQTSSSGVASATPYTLVEVYGVDVLHA